MKAKDIANINFNPFLYPPGCGSVGDISVWVKEQEELESAIKVDPRYPEWMKELEEVKSERTKQRQVAMLARLDLKNKYKNASLNGSPHIYRWGDYEITAPNISFARKLLLGILESDEYGDEYTVQLVNSRPGIISMKKARVLHRPEEDD